MRRIWTLLGLGVMACQAQPEKAETSQIQQPDSVASTASMPDTMPMVHDTAALPSGASAASGSMDHAGMRMDRPARGSGKAPAPMNHSMMNMEPASGRPGKSTSQQHAGMKMNMPAGQTMQHAPSPAANAATQKIDELVKRLLQDSLVRARIERDSALKRLAKSATGANEPMKHE